MATSPASPQEGLRRRGKSGNDELWSAHASTSKQPISPTRSHARTPSSLSDGFGDFVTPEDLQDEQRASTSPGAIDEDWQDADFVQSFSPVTSPAVNAVPMVQEPKPPSFLPSHLRASGSALNNMDWEAWETPRGPSPNPQSPIAGKGATEMDADEAFFAAFEQASSISHPSKASPPIIDLRDMEKKLEEQKKQKVEKQGSGSKDFDFFQQFEDDPKNVLSGSRGRASSKSALRGSQLESMWDAQASPINIASPSAHPQPTDYFDKGRSFSPSDTRGKDAEVTSMPSSPTSLRRSDSWSNAAGQWAGTFRRTLGSLRGQAADLANHLPSAKDFIVPEGDYEDENDGVGSSREKDADVDTNDQHPRHRRIVKAADHSHSTPFGNGTNAGPASPPLPARRQSNQSGTVGGARLAPFSGAPGFIPQQTRNWNTGSWSLSSTEELKRYREPIKVNLKGRREETQDVISEGLAAHLTAHLPKRLQLGRTWRLLYSSDQHGISLGTLYHKVQSGLEIGGDSRKTSMGVGESEGWLRGASQATQEAITGVRRVGGGLSLHDAGMMVAIKDSNSNIFGSYVNERLRAQTSYYGNGECFLWKATDDDRVKTFKWTGRNDYMALTENHYLSFGGGEGKYGLWVDGQMEKGISSRCPAFDNEVLCASDGDDDSIQEGKFECIFLEVWACGID